MHTPSSAAEGREALRGGAYTPETARDRGDGPGGDAASLVRPGRRSLGAAREELFLAVAAVCNGLVVVLSRHFPYQDAPNHLARYVLMGRAWGGDPPPNVVVRLVPDSYLGLDLVGVGLVRALGPAAAGKALALAAVTALPLGLYALLRRVAPEQRGWALAGALLSFNWFVLAGMLNYALGVGLALGWLAWWWPRRGDARPREAAALAAGAAALMLLHLTAPLILLVVIWVEAAAALWSAPDARGRSWPARVGAPRLLVVAAATAAVAAAVAWVSLTGGEVASAGVTFRSAASKVAAFGAPFYSLSLAQAAAMAAAYAAVLGAFAYTNRRALRRPGPFALAALAFLALFLVFPKDVGGAGGTDVRWLLPLYLLPFCAAGRAAPRPARAALGVALAACLAHAGVLWAASRPFDRRLDEYDAALRAVPAGARLLPLVSDQARYPRVGPYQQYAHWHAIRAGGQVPGLWAAEGTREGEPAIPHLRHFSVRRLTYYPSHRWGTSEFGPLDWARIAREYDYIVQYSETDSVRAYVAAHADSVAGVGPLRVFRVRAPTAAAAR